MRQNKFESQSIEQDGVFDVFLVHENLQNLLSVGIFYIKHFKIFGPQGLFTPSIWVNPVRLLRWC